jgi:predicted HicB family RNase H-like nuclease
MAEAPIEQTQLATRIPKDLHRRLKLYCVQAEVSLMDFVTDAVREKLGGKGRRKRGAQ